MSKSAANERVLFAIADDTETGDGIPVVILGIPKAAWERIKDGMTETFDLNKAGLPVKIVLFGGPDRASIEKLLKSAPKANYYRDRTGENFGIDPTKA